MHFLPNISFCCRGGRPGRPILVVLRQFLGLVPPRTHQLSLFWTGVRRGGSKQRSLDLKLIEKNNTKKTINLDKSACIKVLYELLCKWLRIKPRQAPKLSIINRSRTRFLNINRHILFHSVLALGAVFLTAKEICIIELEFKVKVKAFRKMESPVDSIKRTKYVCYAQCDDLPLGMKDWMSVNPRERKMNTNVALKIKDSLERNPDFHELNRGILLSAESVDYDNKTETVKIVFADYETHGSIDGGHTLYTILDNKKLFNDRYVFLEIITGLKSPVKLAEARNTFVQVDLKSIEELKGTFEVLKNILSTETTFHSRVQYKMHDNEKDIDVREIVAILAMFSQEMYPKNSEHPIQCYSGKEATLKRFLKFGQKEADKTSETNRNKMLENMKPVIKMIFALWEKIETTFAYVGRENYKRYGVRKYSRYTTDDRGNAIKVGESLFEEQELKYIVPKGLMYPLVAAFRSLIEVDNQGVYGWKENPITMWEDIGGDLVSTILTEKQDNPDILAKNDNLWGHLFMQVLIKGYVVQ